MVSRLGGGLKSLRRCLLTEKDSENAVQSESAISDLGISTFAFWQLLLRGDERKRVAGTSCQVVGLVERDVACSCDLIFDIDIDI